jgi:hypothetical protein
MSVSPSLIAGILVASVSLISLPARADGRIERDACQAMIDRAAQTRQETATTGQDEAALQRCRQIVRDWTLRDSRMSVDEQGRPLR